MAQHYRAICKSNGFRGRYWTTDDIAYDVQDSEGIMPELFAPIHKDEIVVPPPEPDEDNTNTLSGLLPKVSAEGKVPETLSEAQALEVQEPVKPHRVVHHAKKHAKAKK